MRELQINEVDVVSGGNPLVTFAINLVSAAVWDIVANGNQSVAARVVNSYSNVVTPGAHAAGARMLASHGVFLGHC